MLINSIDITNIRNLKYKSLQFQQKSFLKGKNGSGKTSVLESVFFSFTGKSFRSNRLQDIISDEENYAFIKSEVEDENGFLREIKAGIDKNGTKKLSLDGEDIHRKEILSITSTVIHVPDDIELLSGGPSRRRDFLDKMIFIDDRSYINILLNYKKYLKHKSELLRHNSLKNLEYLNRGAISFIETIRNKRKETSEKVEAALNSILNSLKIDFSVELHVPVELNTEAKLAEKLEKEIIKGFCLYGPHLDNITIKINTRNSRSVSMGEMCFLSILMKCAEIKIHAENKIYPVFLIDDIFAFIDEERKNILINILKELKNQVIITSSLDVKPDEFYIIEI